MYCSERSLVKHCPAGAAISILWCNSWGCEWCGARRAWKCAADMQRGLPFMFLTLTVNPRRGINREQRARSLLDAFRKWVRKVRREHGKESCEYYYVFEDTKKGEPHLHIVGRWPRIEKEDISAFFEKEIEAPSTRIEGIKSANGLAQYLTDYLTKGPTRFGTLKRYGYSRKYFIKARPEQYIADAWKGAWAIVERDFRFLIVDLWWRGYRYAVTARPGYIEFLKPKPEPPPRPIFGGTGLHGSGPEWVRP